jgi:hypothetical protein
MDATPPSHHDSDKQAYNLQGRPNRGLTKRSTEPLHQILIHLSLGVCFSTSLVIAVDWIMWLPLRRS